MIFFYETLFILVALVLTLAMFAFVGRGGNQKTQPVVVSPEMATKHSVLIYLIRGTGATISGAAGLAATYFAIHCVIGALRGGTGTLGWPGVLIAVVIAIAVLGLISYVGYEMWLRVDTTAASNFAFIFALLLSVSWSNSLPLPLPKAVAESFAGNAFFYPFLRPGPGPTYRYDLGLVAFFIFYKLTKAWVLRTLDLNPVPFPKAPPEPPDDSSIPEFPPRSPLVEL